MTTAASHVEQNASNGAEVRSVLSVADLQLEELLAVLEPTEHPIRLEGGSYLVDIPAWRTHLSTAIDEAIVHHGGSLVRCEWPALWIDRDAPLGRTLSPPLRAAFIGVEEHDALRRFTAHATVPIINATSDQHQPVHVLADLLTVRDLFGHLRGLRIAFVGGPNNYRRSIVEAAVRAGVELVITATQPDDELRHLLEENRPIAQLFGGSIHLVDATRGVLEVDVVLGEPVPFALLATSTHLPLHLTGAAAESGASAIEGPRSLLFHRQENLQRVILRLLELVGATAV
jgi:ornithine carbamoyltransferase